MVYDRSGWKEVEFTFEGLDRKAAYLDILENEVRVGLEDEIKSVTRIDPPLKVGDHVRYKVTRGEAVVLGVDDDDAWIRWKVGKGRAVLAANQLELVR